jgi:hypothetical protein
VGLVDLLGETDKDRRGTEGECIEVIESNGDMVEGRRETGRRESGECRCGQSS